MAVSLIDWIYDGPGVGALIVFPPMLNRWNVAAMIVEPWKMYQIVVITDSIAEFEAATAHVSEHQFMLHTFSDLLAINQLLQNPSIDLILFDDAKMLSIIMEGLDWGGDTPRGYLGKIFVLSTWGDMGSHLEIVTQKLPSLHLLTLDFINDTAAVEWHQIATPMSPYQYGFYNHLRQYETSHPSAIPYPLTRMATLYTYPAEIADDIIKHQRICQTDQTTFPDADTPGQARWMHAGYLDLLEENGPKLAALLDGIVAQWPHKQVVFTRFNHRYGVDLITSFLDLLRQIGKNPYELSEIYPVRCTDDPDLSIQQVRAFNGANSGILITNVIPTLALTDISNVHIVDTYAFRDVATLIDRCHKRNLQSKILSIHLYVATTPTPDQNRASSELAQVMTSDQILSAQLTQSVMEANKLYQGLKGAALPIKYDLGSGSVVIQ